MSIHRQARYEFTLFRPKSEDPTETQVLTQLEDTGQEFVVTTDRADDHPYLAIPRGRSGQIKMPKREVEVGSSTIRVLDAQVTGQLDRWVTRFVGDAQGLNRLKGLKGRLREWDSSTSSWTTVYTRRVRSVRMAGSKLWIDLELKDMVEDLETRVFTGPPDAGLSYVSRGSLLPAGLVDEWAGVSAVEPLRGTVSVIQPGAAIEVDRTNVDRGRDVLIQALQEIAFDAGPQLGLNFLTAEIVPGARVRMKILASSAEPGRVGEEGDFWLAKTVDFGGNWFFPRKSPISFQMDDQKRARVTRVGFDELRPEDPNYMALPAEGSVVEFHVFGHGPATERNPILIGPVHPAQLVEDLVDGRFGPLVDSPFFGTVGAPVLSFPTDGAAFAALKSDPSFGEIYLVATEEKELRKLIEEHLNLAHGLGYRIDELGRYVPIDWRLTSGALAGLEEIGDDDVVPGEDDALDWDDTADGAITLVRVHYYTDVLQVPWQLRQIPEGVPDVPAVSFATSKHQQDHVLERFGQLGEDPLTIDAIGIRDIVAGVRDDSTERVKALVSRVVNGFRSPFGNGPRYLTLRCRPTNSVKGCLEGSLRRLTYSPIIDPATRRRGGARLARCVQRSSDREHLILKFLDLGADVVATAPILGAAVQNATDGEHAVDVPVTLNGDDEPAVIEYAITETSVGIRPGEDAEDWLHGGRLTQDGTLVVGAVPSGKRIWIRGRSEPSGAQDPKLPSSWVFPTGSGYADTGALPAPTGLSLVPEAGSLVATWTPGRSDLAVMPVIAVSPDPAVDALAQPLPEGSERYVFDQLDDADSYVAGVKHVDGFGGESPVVTSTASPLAPLQLSPPRRVQIRQGRAQNTPEASSPDSIGYGMWVGFKSKEPLAGHRIQVSPQENFSTIEFEAVIDPGVELYPVFVQRDGGDQERHVRLQAQREGYTPSPWSTAVSAWPTELLATPGPDRFPGGYADVVVRRPGMEIEKRIGNGGDEDTDRAYFAFSHNPSPFVYPQVDEDSDYIDRSAMPHVGTVANPGGGGDLIVQTGDMVAGRVRFWSERHGFGSEALIRYIVPDPHALEGVVVAVAGRLRPARVPPVGTFAFQAVLSYLVGVLVTHLRISYSFLNGGVTQLDREYTIAVAGDGEHVLEVPPAGIQYFDQEDILLAVEVTPIDGDGDEGRPRLAVFDQPEDTGIGIRVSDGAGGTIVADYLEAGEGIDQTIVSGRPIWSVEAGGGVEDHGALTGLTDDDHAQYVHTSIARTISALHTFANALGIRLNVISERTGGAGVTVDGLLIKDGGIPEGAVTAHEAALTILESQIQDGSVLARLAADETIQGDWSYSGRGRHIVHNYGNRSSSFTVNAANGNIQRVTLTGAFVTISLTGFASGVPVLLLIEYGGGYQPNFGGGVHWGEPGEPNWSANSSNSDLVYLVQIGSLVLGSAVVGYLNPT